MNGGAPFTITEVMQQVGDAPLEAAPLLPILEEASSTAPLDPFMHLQMDVEGGALQPQFIPETPLASSWGGGGGEVVVRLSVSREHIVDTLLDAMDDARASLLTRPRAKLEVRFVGETGIGEGIARDMLHTVMAALSRPEMDLFRACPHDPSILHPSPTCAVSHPIGEGAYDVVDLMRLAGRAMGLALRLRVPLGFRPSQALVRMMFNLPMNAACMRELFPEVAGSLRAVLDAVDACDDHDDAVRAMCLPGFVAPDAEDPARDRELVEGGANLEVTRSNAALFVALMTNHYCGRQGGAYLASIALRDGLTWAMGMPDLTSASRLRMLAHVAPAAFARHVCGEVVLDVDAWRALTNVHVSPDAAGGVGDAAAATFWTAVEGMDHAQRRALLRFWTGCTALAGGERMQLCLYPSASMRIPSSHTCFRQLHVYVPDRLSSSAMDAGDLRDLLVYAVRMQDGSIND
jgi:hypothetical protein